MKCCSVVVYMECSCVGSMVVKRAKLCSSVKYCVESKNCVVV